MKQHEYYSVAIGNSTTMQRKPAPDKTCGHKHRTYEAAEQCQKKLLGYHKEKGTHSIVCSAEWYNSYILGRNNNEWERIR